MLNRLIDYGEAITLVPQSGIQFVEYGLDVDSGGQFSRTFIERPTGRGEAGNVEVTLVPNWDDDHPRGDPPHAVTGQDDEYTISKKRAVDVFLNRWIPVPFLRVQPGRDAFGNETFADGPADWVRVKLVETRETYGDEEASHRVIFAFDTTLVERREGRPYLGLSLSDAEQSESFRFVHRLTDIASFVSNKVASQEPDKPAVDTQAWLTNWLKNLFREVKAAQYPRRPLRDDDFPHHLEHIAAYITFIGFLAEATRPAKVVLIDTVSKEPRVAPIDVDLVLDIGNSRSCGLLIQTFPNDQTVDLNRSLVLEMRDLSRPELIYREPFESHVELVHAEFGPEDLAKKSGRSRAFFWPSLVRLGREASRFRSESEGTEAMTGLSSPKRYLWDVDPVSQAWRFRNPSGQSADVQPLIERSLYKYVNERGDVLEQLEADRRNHRLKIRPELKESAETLRFSRSSFFTFMLVEMISQALMMINNPGARRRDREKDAPRRLRSIVLTIPSATPIQEQRIIRSRAEAAISLLWSLMGWEADTPGAPARPTIQASWDEASAVHLVYLYGEITQKLGGDIQLLLDFLGKKRPVTDHLGRIKEAEPRSSLRIASVDVGGGTTDLMVTTYHQDDNRLLLPTQNFREGFRRAGDDLVKLVIERAVLPAIAAQLTESGMSNARETLRERFADDSPNMSEQEKHLRRQFVLRMLRPVALGLLQVAEQRSSSNPDTSLRSYADFFAPRDPQFAEGNNILDYLQAFARRRGAEGFSLAEVPIAPDLEAIDGCIRLAFEPVFTNIAEAIHKLDVDVVLLTGRPTCLPGVISLFTNQHAVPVDRVVPIRDYRVGNWYPFRRPAQSLIDDPKTTAVVGGTLCSLASGQLTNFALRTQGMAMRSTVNFIGEMRQDGIIPDDKIYFSDIDLDNPGSGETSATIRYYTAVRLGYRQLAREDWVAAPLYRLRAQPGNHRDMSTPVAVLIERSEAETDEDDPDASAIMNSEATREEFVIQDAEEMEGRNRNVKNWMEMRLDTSSAGADGTYWLDSGILTVA